MKLLDKLILCLWVVISGLILFILLVIAVNANVIERPFSRVKYCKSKSEAIENSNNGSLDYWKNYIDSEYDSMLLSPLCVQYSLHDYYDNHSVQKSDIYKSFNNGWRSWESSCIDEPSFTYLEPIDASELKAIIGSVDYKPSYVYSICKIDDKLRNCYFDGEYIHYQGEAVVSGDSVKLSLGSDYEIIFTRDFDKGFNLEWETEDVDILIEPYVWRATGTPERLLSEFNSGGTRLYMIAQFGFDSDVYEKKDMSTEYRTITYDTDYSFVIQNKNTGLIILIGRR